MDIRRILAAGLLALAASPGARAVPPLFDFTRDAGRQGWQATHDISRLAADPEGLRIDIDGGDPYAVGPPVRVPAGTPLWLRMRLKASASGMGQVFYFTPSTGPAEPRSVRFPVRAGRWEIVRVPLPPLPEARMRFRIDPPGEAGEWAVLASVALEPRILLTEPRWPRPTPPALKQGIAGLRLGPGAVLVQGKTLGSLLVMDRGAVLAVGNEKPRLGYQVTPEKPLRWVDLSKAKTTVRSGRGRLDVEAVMTDPDGGRWTIVQRFAPLPKGDGAEVLVTARVSAPRVLAYLPALTLLPGLGAFGSAKDQALLAGVEYLDRNEPSSSEADLRGEQARRQVPDPHMPALPLMALAQGGRWIALSWERADDVAPCFDSPDRRFRSGAHLMGLLFPGGVHPPGSLMPQEGSRLAPGETLRARACIQVGRGASVLPAVQAWVARQGLPPVPRVGGLEAYVRLATAGWLDSKVRAGDLYRHAYPGDFAPHPAADAATAMAWLAAQTGDAGRAAQLREASAAAFARTAPGDTGGVGHVSTLAPALVTGTIAETIRRAREEGPRHLAGLREDGSVRYTRRPDGLDYGATHFEDTANGLTAPALVAGLQAALLTGDTALRDEALRRLRQAQARWRNTVPRGAQTWEVPLHTPDILASAHLVKAFVLGYELSGDRLLLEAARHWAWTGVPFTYLTAPAAGPVGLYATTPVLGATQWIAPNWIGLPVQWCGLVYADALLDLAVHDPGGIWKRLADGIIASGYQQSWPVGSNAARQGLLPDSFSLAAQVRNDVAINPATLLVPAARSLGRPIYTRTPLAFGGPFVHAPGVVERKDAGSIVVRGWPAGQYQVLLSCLMERPREIRINGRLADGEYDAANRSLTLEVAGTATIEWR